jgi:hypothetical protein
MLPRLLPLLVLPLVVGLAPAAPAPLRKSEPPQPEVMLTGRLPRDRVPVGDPCAITCQADWQAVAKAWGIQNPPRVNFRTHFLAVHVWNGHGTVRFEADGDGGLRVINEQPDPNDYRLYLPVASGPRYLIRSFRRCDVAAVKGVPLPRP